MTGSVWSTSYALSSWNLTVITHDRFYCNSNMQWNNLALINFLRAMQLVMEQRVKEVCLTPSPASLSLLHIQSLPILPDMTWISHSTIKTSLLFLSFSPSSLPPSLFLAASLPSDMMLLPSGSSVLFGYTQPELIRIQACLYRCFLLITVITISD